MKISGFTFARNAAKLYYPIKESILSILPIVDEFVIALGDSDDDDRTEEELLCIKSDKIKIINTKWNLNRYPRGMEHAHQTDIAKQACSGDWLFYLQADEVVHEKYLPIIKERCEQLLNHDNVEGLLFKYKHFWGDYNHYHISHGWYPFEIRIIRNNNEIHSWESAQSFRRMPEFDGLNYRQKKNTSKLKVAMVDAYIFHYGWVRPPELMKNKIKYFNVSHKGKKIAQQIFNNMPEEFDYGPLNRLEKFHGTHPAVMIEWIKKFNWQHKLQYTGKPYPFREKHKHERLKYRLLTFFEQKIFNGKSIGGFKNYRLMKNF